MKFSGAVFMKSLGLLALLALSIFVVPATFGQTQTPLTNADIIHMTTQGFDAALIVKDIQSSSTEFDTSPQALINLKNAGVDKSVLEAMLAAQSAKPSGTVEAVHGGITTDPSQPPCSPKTGCLLKEGNVLALKLAADLNSKTAHEGDPVEFLLDDDLKVAGSIVVPKGAHAVATVTDAKKAGMMGRPGELSVQMQYLVSGTNHAGIRGTKGREGDSKTGAAVALTVLFGPIGLIKHGKNGDIPAGTAQTAYVDQDIWLAPIN
jgi:hypothetical protein